MKYCPKCKKQFPEGNFCEFCENDDGTPVRLKDEAILCVRCGKEYPAGTKFCSDCGVRLGTNDDSELNSGFRMGDKNVISGDVTSNVHHNESIKSEVHHNETVTNTTTNTTTTNYFSRDDTKESCQCHVCGRIILKVNSYVCKKCNNSVCTDCYDEVEKSCVKCSGKKKAVSSKELERFVSELRSYDLMTDKGRAFVEHYLVSDSASEIKAFVAFCSNQRDVPRSEDLISITFLWNNKILSLISQGFEHHSEEKEFHDYLNQKKKEAEECRKLETGRILSEENKRKRSQEELEKKKKVEQDRKEKIKKASKILALFKRVSWKLKVVIILLIAIFINYQCYVFDDLVDYVTDMIEQRKVGKIMNGVDFSETVVVKKENIIIQGYAGKYLEVVNDGKLFYVSGSYSIPDVCLTVDVKKTGSFCNEFNKQVEDFKKKNNVREDKDFDVIDTYLSLDLPGLSSSSCNIFYELLTPEIGNIIHLTIVKSLRDTKRFKKFRDLKSHTSIVIESNGTLKCYDENGYTKEYQSIK